MKLENFTALIGAGLMGVFWSLTITNPTIVHSLLFIVSSGLLLGPFVFEALEEEDDNTEDPQLFEGTISYNRNNSDTGDNQ